MKMKIVAAVLSLMPVCANAASVASVTDENGNVIAQILSGQSGAAPNARVCWQANPSTTAQIYGCGNGAGGLQISGLPSSGGGLYLGLSGDFVGIGTNTPAGILDVEGGTAVAGANGARVLIHGQNAGVGTTTVGGDIIVTPGQSDQGGANYVGTINLDGVTYVNNAAGATVAKFITGASGTSSSGIQFQGGGGSQFQVFGIGLSTNITMSGRPVPGGTLTLGLSGDVTTFGGSVITGGDSYLNGSGNARLHGNGATEIDVLNNAGGYITKFITSNSSNSTGAFPELVAGGGLYAIFAAIGTGNVITQIGEPGFDVSIGAGTALAASATTGFLGLPFTNGAPTGTPANAAGPHCEWNDTSRSFNCYSPSAAAWYGIAMTAGAK